MLFVVATPIGNLEDITFRAIKTLFSVDIILCEDTRKTFNLLKLYQQEKQVIPKLVSFYEENEATRIPWVMKELKLGKNIALVSNSGTPTLSDPGFKLIRECVINNVRVIPVPGPSAITAAISCSGLPTDKFIYLGFLPNKINSKKTLFLKLKKSLDNIKTTVIFFESPYRLSESLTILKDVFGDIEVVIWREITKIHEEFIRKKISEFLEEIEKNSPKGEFVVLFHLETNN